jgi:tRNA:m4X modification enzyme
VPEYCKLIEKIESVHGLICKDIWDSYKILEACIMWSKGEVDG